MLTRILKNLSGKDAIAIIIRPQNLFLAFFLLVLIGLSVSACSVLSLSEKKEVFRIALILPGVYDDYSINQSMYESLLAFQVEMGGAEKVEIAVSDRLEKVPDVVAAMRAYAAEGYDLVIVHGSQYGSSVAQVASDYPRTSFAWGLGKDTFQSEGVYNVFVYDSRSMDAGYVEGMLAAKISKTGLVGALGPVALDDALNYISGFKQGAEEGHAKVSVSWTGSFTDAELMAAAAETHINNGADVLTGISQSVAGAVLKCDERGVYWMGAQYNQMVMAPKVVAVSFVYDWKDIIQDMMETRQRGVPGGKLYTLTFQNNGIRMDYNPSIELPEEAKKAAEDALQGILSGNWIIEVDQSDL